MSKYVNEAFLKYKDRYQLEYNGDYSVRITGADKDHNGKYPMLEKFADLESNEPIVVTTSRLLTTGIDVKTIRNVVLFRNIGSMVEFKQIIGRGTRISALTSIIKSQRKEFSMQNQPKLLLDLIALRERWREMPDYGCFWSSPDNQRGFRLTPKIEAGKVSVEMTIDREQSGFPGIAHGGVSFTILDGLMGWYVMSHYGRAGLTTNSSIEYSAPLFVGKTYLFQAIEDSENAFSPKGTVKLVGQVFNANLQEKPLLQMKATFFLPNRKTATLLSSRTFEKLWESQQGLWFKFCNIPLGSFDLPINDSQIIKSTAFIKV